MRFLCIIVLFPLGCFGYTILIDPGHGGSDHGAVYSGVKESDLVLAISKDLQARMAQDSGFKVYLSRDNDMTLALSDRIELAKEIKADLIISLHANAAKDPRARGVELYVQSPLVMEEEKLFLAHQESQVMPAAEASENSRGLSKARDVAAIVEDLYRQNKFLKSLEFSELMRQMWRGQRQSWPVHIKQAPFYVVSKSHIPAVLVEVGFLSHPQESKMLKDVKYQEEIAAIIHGAILQFLPAKNSDKGIAIY